MEFIYSGDEFLARDSRNLLGNECVEATRRVKPRAYGGTAESKLAKRLYRALDKLNIPLKA